jgi:hypothetical protein
VTKKSGDTPTSQQAPTKAWKAASGKRGRARSGGPRKLADALSGLADPVFRRRGFAIREIVTRWPAIVGEQLAAQSCPEKLAFPVNKGADAALHIRTSGPLALELQHLAPLIIDRVNTYYGYPAVSRLVLQQGPIPERPQTKVRSIRSLSADEQTNLTRAVSPVRDGDLRSALAALGHSIIASDK